jgi:amino acid transporter
MAETTTRPKAFGTASAAMLGIGSMVGAGIFIVIGQAGSIAGNIVWLSFVIGGVAALLSGYSLAKLALRYPSRGGIVEYLVQGFGEGVFSGAASILFYFRWISIPLQPKRHSKPWKKGKKRKRSKF